MASVPNELDSFCSFLDGLRQEPTVEMSPEEALAEWRAQQMSPQEFQESVQALREAIQDMEAGDKGVSFDEIVAAMRHKYNLSA